jgi:probable F420-dependent oxidoreductase
MKCILLLHTQKVDLGAEFASAGGVMEIARAAEAAGFEAVAVTDHPIPHDEWMRSGGHHALDPFVALSFAAAATTRLRLLTYIYVLPYRNPFLSAKAAATLDVLSGGRFVFGIAAGYLEPEFQALGVPFAERSELTDEAIRVMKRAWTESGIDVEGRHFAAHGHTALPRPVQQPHPPIWVGGNSKQAIRRAVELGDGWMPIYNPPEFAARRRTAVIQSPADIAARLGYAAEVGRAVGRTASLAVLWTAQGLARFGTPSFEREGFVAHVAELAAAGVTHIVVHLPAASRAEHAERIARFGAEILPALR